MEPNAASSEAHKKVRLYGRDNSPAAYEIRDFLCRSVVEFDWVEVGSLDNARKQLELPTLSDTQLPVVEMPGGERLLAPTIREIADHLGWIAEPRLAEYDLSIYGAGPAGLSAAVYAASEGLRTIVIEREAVGGQAGTSSLIENYLGFPQGIRGSALAERARQQAVKFGAEILLLREGKSAEFKDNRIIVENAGGGKVTARASICATGVAYRRLGLPNEQQFLERGFFYGVGASDAKMCGGEHVFVVGGGNSAGQAVMNFCQYAAKVTMVVRGGSLAESLSQYLIDRIKSQPNAEVVYNTDVSALDGDSRLRQVTLRSNRDSAERTADADRLYVCIGGVPHTDWARETPITRDPAGYLMTGPDLLDNGQRPANWNRERNPYYLETSVPGLFVAGDVRHGSVKRVASAVGEGAMAVTFAHKFLGED